MKDEQGRVNFSDNLTIKFDGANTIELQELIGYISGIDSAYQAYLDSEYHNPDIKIQVVAIQKGSFEIVLQSAVALLPSLITNLPTAISSYKTIMDIIKLKKELKGQEPQKIEQENDSVKITNHEGNISYYDCTVTNNYFNNSKIDAGISSAFASMRRDESREAVRMVSGQNEIIIPNENYIELSKPIIDASDDKPETQSRVVEVRLKVRKLDFLCATMWSFIDENDRNLTATIEDVDFQNRVSHGKIQLSANDVLCVRMRIEADLDKYLNVDRKRYYIEKVIGVTSPTKFTQISIDEIGNQQK